MSQSPALIIMAAGIGSRYGGLKQVDPIGPNGEIVIDYAIFDALRAGFERVIFLIRRDIEDVFREKVGRHIEQRVDTTYVFQDLHHVPAGFPIPPDRKKPWGTGHAVLSCKGVLEQPFAVINADDFYGLDAFQAMADFLRAACDPPGGPYQYSMVGYILRNTLSTFGSVARGICQIDANGLLESIHERTKIQPFGEEVKYTENGTDWIPIAADSVVSMNMFGFTPSILSELETRFPVFLEQNAANLLKAEFFLPDVVNQVLQEGKAQVRVLPTGDRWFGVTYPEDRAFVQQAIRDLVRRGVYPERLWI